MDNARDALQFGIMPCPRCGKKFTVADVQKMEDGTDRYGLLHTCPAGPETGFYCYGGNLRAVVQNWNESLRRYLECQTG